jgi:rRNA-processing protein FCF1
MLFFFVDSNLFLQCRPLPQLDWDRFAGLSEATVLIPSAVLAELDKHKADGNNRRAQRARAALKLFDSMLESASESVALREKPACVIARFAPEVPSDDSRSNDDSILFEVEQLARTEGNEAVALITHDTNLKVKARRRGLRFLSVPDDWLLAPEPDERDRRVKQLEERVALLEKQTPVIEISLEAGGEIELLVPDYQPLPATTVDRLVEAMTARFPMKTDFALTPTEKLMSVGGVGMFNLHPPSELEIANYQSEEYPKWEKTLRSRLQSLHTNLRLSGTAEIRLLIANAGTVPAEHVQVAIRMSEGLLNVDIEQHEKMLAAVNARPRAPKPPEPRRLSIGGLGGLHGIPDFGRPSLPEMPIRHDRDEFYRKSGKDVDTEWVWECENMRHGGEPEEFCFRIGLNAFARPSGGQMIVEVSAENLPKAHESRFPVRIVYVPGDLEAVALKWLGLT